MKLHASGEDYLEAILILQKKGEVHSVDVARHLGVTKASSVTPYRLCVKADFLQKAITII